jgi:prevent-host-death family protein
VFVIAESSNHKGAVAEAKIAAAAIELGVPVLRPMTERGRYDLVFDLGSRLLRVQCKWAAFRAGVVQISVGGNYLSARGYVQSTYSDQDIDALAAYCAELARCYLLPVELVAGKYAIHLRVQAAKNSQRAALNWAAQYELGAIAQLGERRAGSAKGGGSSPPGSTGSAEPEARPSAVEVGAHVFRNHFGWYMQRAHAGEEILITRRGRPHARLGPPHPQLAAA